MTNKNDEQNFDRITDAFQDMMDSLKIDGYVSEEIIATGLIIFLRQTVLVSHDIKNSLKFIEKIVNDSLDERGKQ